MGEGCCRRLSLPDAPCFRSSARTQNVNVSFRNRLQVIANAAGHTPSAFFSGPLAQTGRSRAQARRAALSAARVVESGTVEERAVSRSSVVSSGFLAAGETGLAPSLLKAE